MSEANITAEVLSDIDETLEARHDREMELLSMADTDTLAHELSVLAHRLFAPRHPNHLLLIEAAMRIIH